MNPALDCDALQQDMETIYKWAEEVNMVFNSDKFECLRFWPGRMEVPAQQYQPIENKDHLRDLIFLSESTSKKNISSSSKLVGWAFRTFRRRSMEIHNSAKNGLL